MCEEDFEFGDVPAYATLAANNIDNPALLVQHAIERGEIHPAKPATTKPRCPVGKKAAAIAAKSSQQQARSARFRPARADYKPYEPPPSITRSTEAMRHLLDAAMRMQA